MQRKEFPPPRPTAPVGAPTASRIEGTAEEGITVLCVFPKKRCRLLGGDRDRRNAFQAKPATANRRKPTNPTANHASSGHRPTRNPRRNVPLPSVAISLSRPKEKKRLPVSGSGSPTHPLRAVFILPPSTSRKRAVGRACLFDSADRKHDTARHVHVAGSQRNRRRGHTREEEDRQALEAHGSTIRARKQGTGSDTPTQEWFRTCEETARSTTIQQPTQACTHRILERI